MVFGSYFRILAGQFHIDFMFDLPLDAAWSRWITKNSIGLFIISSLFGIHMRQLRLLVNRYGFFILMQFRFEAFRLWWTQAIIKVFFLDDAILLIHGTLIIINPFQYESAISILLIYGLLIHYLTLLYYFSGGILMTCDVCASLLFFT